jgi:hypothetical protein
MLKAVQDSGDVFGRQDVARAMDIVPLLQLEHEMEASGAGGAKAEVVKVGKFEGSFEIRPGVLGTRAEAPITGVKGHALAGVDVVVGKTDNLCVAERVIAGNGKCSPLTIWANNASIGVVGSRVFLILSSLADKSLEVILP